MLFLSRPPNKTDMFMVLAFSYLTSVGTNHGICRETGSTFSSGGFSNYRDTTSIVRFYPMLRLSLQLSNHSLLSDRVCNGTSWPLSVLRV